MEQALNFSRQSFTRERINFLNSSLKESDLLPRCNDTSDTELTSRIAIGVILGFINLMTIGGNILVLVAVARNRKLRTVTNYFVVSLATADLTLGVCVLPFSTTLQLVKKWKFGRMVCDFWAAIDVLCCTASIFSLCAISIDRYIGVTRPLQHRNIMSRKRATLIIVALWLLSVGISIGPLIGWRDNSDLTGLEVCQVTTDIGYVVFSTLSSFYIPAAVIIIIYVKIYREAVTQSRFLKTGIKEVRGGRKNAAGDSPLLLRVHSRHSRVQQNRLARPRQFERLYSAPPTSNNNEDEDEAPHNGHRPLKHTSSDLQTSDKISTHDNTTNNNSSHWLREDDSALLREQNRHPTIKEMLLSTKLLKFNKEKKAAKTLGIVVGVFLFCWTPFFLVLPIDSLCSQCSVPTVLFDIVFWLGYCNSLLNPVIYAVWNNDFRNTFKDILSCRVNKKVTTTTTTAQTNAGYTYHRPRLKHF